jgi:phosphatidylinositol alpha-1,6-mannosyltransferase
MRILLVTWNYPPKIGGMERLLSQLVKSLRDYADVDVMAPYSGETEVGSYEGTQIVRPSRDGLAWFAWHALYEGLSMLRTKDYDVIVGGSALLTPMVIVLGRLFSLPIAVNVYGLDLIYAHPLYQLMVKAFLPRCSHIFAISEASKREALQRGISPERISVVYPGLDFSEFERLRDARRIRQQHGFDGRSILLSVGRLARRKGIPEFVKHCIPTIVEKHPDALYLVVGGNPTDSLSHKEDIRSQVEDTIRQLQLGNHVRLLGRVERDELIDLYHACDVFVLPAVPVSGDMEGFGIVLTEAAAAGKPVVSTRLGGIPDAVVDGESGILVEPGEWDQLSEAVLTLLTDEALRQKLGHSGRERAKTQLDWPVIAAEYAEYLRTLSGSRHS